MPAACTVKLAVCAATTLASLGWVVIDGVAGAALTLNKTAALVVLPALLLTTTRSCLPLSASVTAPRVSVAAVSPGRSAQVLPSLLACHW